MHSFFTFSSPLLDDNLCSWYFGKSCMAIPCDPGKDKNETQWNSAQPDFSITGARLGFLSLVHIILLQPFLSTAQFWKNHSSSN